MQVEVAKSAGFCFGVKRSVDLVEEKLDKGEKVFLFKQLIHNPVVIKKLTDKGAKIVDLLDEVPKEGTVVFRAHGEPPKSYENAKNSDLCVVDLTCPFVGMVQKKAKQMEEEGYQVIIVGEKDHPEVIGILANTKKGIIFENATEAKEFFAEEQYASTSDLLDKKESEVINDLYSFKLEKIAIVSQTTQTDENFSSIVSVLSGKAREVRAFNTICNATHTRQPAAEDLAKKVDVMIVVGGKNSGNTQRLYDLASKHTKTYKVETEDELQKEWFIGKNTAGITAGASTPQESIDAVKKWIEKI